MLVYLFCFFLLVTRAVHNGDQMMERKKAEHISITSNNGDRTLIRKKEFLPKKCNSQLSVAVIGNSDRFESIPQWAQPCSSSERRDYNEVENVYGEIGTDNVLLPASQLQNIDAVNGGMAFNNSEIVSVCHSSPQDDFKAVGMASQSASSEPSSKMSASTLSAGQNFILRPKKRRHVYHEIILPFEHNKLVGNCKDFPAACIGNSRKAGSAPTIPFKPHYLRSEFTGDFPPPLPPRVLNKDAVLQRKHLTEEYFENIRKSMDIDLENDLVLNDLVLPAEASQIGNDEGAGPSRTSVFTENDTNPLPLFKGGSFTGVDHANSLHLHGFLMDNGKEIPYDSSIGKDVTNSVKSHCEAMSKHRIQFVESLKSLKHCGWYWGNMSWEDAETMLAHTPNQEGKLIFIVCYSVSVDCFLILWNCIVLKYDGIILENVHSAIQVSFDRFKKIALGLGNVAKINKCSLLLTKFAWAIVVLTYW